MDTTIEAATRRAREHRMKQGEGGARANGKGRQDECWVREDEITG